MAETDASRIQKLHETREGVEGKTMGTLGVLRPGQSRFFDSDTIRKYSGERRKIGIAPVTASLNTTTRGRTPDTIYVYAVGEHLFVRTGTHVSRLSDDDLYSNDSVQLHGTNGGVSVCPNMAHMCHLPLNELVDTDLALAEAALIKEGADELMLLGQLARIHSETATAVQEVIAPAGKVSPVRRAEPTFQFGMEEAIVPAMAPVAIDAGELQLLTQSTSILQQLGELDFAIDPNSIDTTSVSLEPVTETSHQHLLLIRGSDVVITSAKGTLIARLSAGKREHVLPGQYLVQLFEAGEGATRKAQVHVQALNPTGLVVHAKVQRYTPKPAAGRPTPPRVSQWVVPRNLADVNPIAPQKPQTNILDRVEDWIRADLEDGRKKIAAVLRALGIID